MAHHDIRKGDVLRFKGGHAEVLAVVANNEGGLDLTLRYHENKHELSRTVYRKGGPDEREDDEPFEEPVDERNAALAAAAEKAEEPPVVEAPVEEPEDE